MNATIHIHSRRPPTSLFIRNNLPKGGTPPSLLIFFPYLMPASGPDIPLDASGGNQASKGGRVLFAGRGLINTGRGHDLFRGLEMFITG